MGTNVNNPEWQWLGALKPQGWNSHQLRLPVSVANEKPQLPDDMNQASQSKTPVFQLAAMGSLDRNKRQKESLEKAANEAESKLKGHVQVPETENNHKCAPHCPGNYADHSLWMLVLGILSCGACRPTPATGYAPHRSDVGQKSPRNGISSSGWWLGHASEKYEFVNWDDDIPNISGKNKIEQPNHQPVIVTHPFP